MRPVLAMLLLTGCFVTDAELEAALDRDQDGYQPDITGGPDCEPENPAVNPDAPELCGDGIDNDCDGNIDDRGIGEREWFADADADGWGTGEPVLACNPPEGHVAQLGDCDDADAEISPNALDLCDGVDQDCDEVVDDDATFRTVFVDADQDGFGVATETLLTCGNPVGYADIAGDCDDADGAIQPGLDDFCDGIDQDCDGAIDEDASFTLYFEDSDGDGVGTVDVVANTCDGPPSSYVETAGDCDDLDPTVVIPSWFFDGDGDGHGTGTAVQTCAAPAQHVASSDDCDDADPLRSPSEIEVCQNGIDDDCSTATSCRLEGDLVLPLADSIVFPGEPELQFAIYDVLGGPEPDLVTRPMGGDFEIYDGFSTIVPGAPAATVAASSVSQGDDLDGDGRGDLVASLTGDSSGIFLSGSTGALTPTMTVSGFGPTFFYGVEVKALNDATLGSGVWVGAEGLEGEGGTIDFVPFAPGDFDVAASSIAQIVGAPDQQLGRLIAPLPQDGMVFGGLDGVHLLTRVEVENAIALGVLPDPPWLPNTTGNNLFGGGPCPVANGEGFCGFELDLASFQLETQVWFDPIPTTPDPDLVLTVPPPLVAAYFPTADLDGDGLAEHTFQNIVSSDITVAWPVLYGVTEPPILQAELALIVEDEAGAFSNIRQVVAADLDGDAYGDLVVVSTTADDTSTRVQFVHGTGQ